MVKNVPMSLKVTLAITKHTNSKAENHFKGSIYPLNEMLECPCH